MRKTRKILLAAAFLFTATYIAIAIRVAMYENTMQPLVAAPAPMATVAIFGASGTAGDGILKSALANPDIDTIHVVTRRTTERMRQGVDAGKVIVTTHMDYLDYSDIIDSLAEVDAVFWAIGLSSIGVDEEPYREIHVDFPVQFVTQWLAAGAKPGASFHYISSSDISEESSAMWARVKVEAENELFSLADGSPVRVIAYRPDYIGPTEEEAHLGQQVLYWFFAPIGVAVKATQIGEAMMEVTARRTEHANGDRLGTWKIRKYSDAYLQRLQ